MSSLEVSRDFQSLSTPLIADACVRLGLLLRIAPPGIAPATPERKVAGFVVPVRHYGSVDIFLEAMALAPPGAVLVIDNGGRKDEGCIGDLTVLEAKAHGLSALIVWGLHRDTEELQSIGLPCFSYGSWPAGPRRVDHREPEALLSAYFGSFIVTTQDVAFADRDGVIFVPRRVLADVLSIAQTISRTERRQAEAIKSGRTLREQLKFEEYLNQRAADPGYTFRRHLKRIGGAIEE